MLVVELRDELRKTLENYSVHAPDSAYSSYWSKWVNRYDFKNSRENLRDIYGDYFTPVRWIPENRMMRLFVAIEIFLTNFFSSPKFFVKSILKPSYWRLRRISRKQGRFMNYANIIALSGFNLICSKLKPINQTICIIGDGATNYASLCLSSNNQFEKIVSINLPEVHFVETEMLIRGGVEEGQICVLRDLESLENFFSSNQRLGILAAQNANILKGFDVDIFVNVSSMQEMTHEAISTYFNLIKDAKSVFYCCNRNEKVLPDGSINKFNKYPWGTSDFMLYEDCPWMKKTVNLTRPFIRRQEPHIHALASYRE